MRKEPERTDWSKQTNLPVNICYTFYCQAKRCNFEEEWVDFHIAKLDMKHEWVKSHIPTVKRNFIRAGDPFNWTY